MSNIAQTQQSKQAIFSFRCHDRKTGRGNGTPRSCPNQRGELVWPATRNPGLYMKIVFSDGLDRESVLPIRLTSEDLQEAYQDAEGHWARDLHPDAVGYKIQDEYRASKAEVRKRPSLWPLLGRGAASR